MFFGYSLIRPRKELEHFFCQTLGAVSTWQKLTTKVKEIEARWSKSPEPFSDVKSALNWATSLIGELGTYAILLAVVQEKLKKEPSRQLCRAIDWTELQFELVFKRAMSDSSFNSILQSPEETEELIFSYSETIG